MCCQENCMSTVQLCSLSREVEPGSLSLDDCRGSGDLFDYRCTDDENRWAQIVSARADNDLSTLPLWSS